MTDVKGLRVAVLATDGVEQAELTEPVKALRDAGALPTVVSLRAGVIQGMNQDEKGDRLTVDMTLDQVTTGDFDALLLPGGVANPDKLRMSEDAVAFVRGFGDDGKPIAAICHGPWTLIEADLVDGKRMTSWPSLKTDLRNAGAEWVDAEVVRDGDLVTSRKPDDLPAFNREMLSLFSR